MDDKRVKLVRPEDRVDGDPTPGMHRELAAETDRTWAGFVTTEPGMVSGWHHHADYESHIYVLSGTMQVEFGPEGHESVQAEAGDFIFVPANTVHRESNPATQPSTVVVVRAGAGEAVVNLPGPNG